MSRIWILDIGSWTLDLGPWSFRQLSKLTRQSAHAQLKSSLIWLPWFTLYVKGRHSSSSSVTKKTPYRLLLLSTTLRHPSCYLLKLALLFAIWIRACFSSREPALDLFILWFHPWCSCICILLSLVFFYAPATEPASLVSVAVLFHRQGPGFGQVLWLDRLIFWKFEDLKSWNSESCLPNVWKEGHESSSSLGPNTRQMNELELPCQRSVGSQSPSSRAITVAVVIAVTIIIIHMTLFESCPSILDVGTFQN